LGLDLPWYWDILKKDICSFHHANQIGVYAYRATEWWRPIAGTSPAEREWLEEKYPGWNETYGKCWDVISENIRNGDYEKTVPAPPPLICNMCGLEVVGTAGNEWNAVNHHVDIDDRRYHFCSEPCKWIFEIEPERYKGHKSIIDRVFDGTIGPELDDFYNYMGQRESERGTDGYNYRWVDGYDEDEDAEKKYATG